MKRLITARDVEQAAERHENLCVDDNTIVTAQARDYAKELGVLLEEGICAQECHAHAEAEPAKAHECHHEEAPAERHEEARKEGGQEGRPRARGKAHAHGKAGRGSQARPGEHGQGGGPQAQGGDAQARA